jgi:hypothetical protein
MGIFVLKLSSVEFLCRKPPFKGSHAIREGFWPDIAARLRVFEQRELARPR